MRALTLVHLPGLSAPRQFARRGGGIHTTTRGGGTWGQEALTRTAAPRSCPLPPRKLPAYHPAAPARVRRLGTKGASTVRTIARRSAGSATPAAWLACPAPAQLPDAARRWMSPSRCHTRGTPPHCRHSHLDRGAIWGQTHPKLPHSAQRIRAGDEVRAAWARVTAGQAHRPSLRPRGHRTAPRPTRLADPGSPRIRGDGARSPGVTPAVPRTIRAAAGRGIATRLSSPGPARPR